MSKSEPVKGPMPNTSLREWAIACLRASQSELAQMSDKDVRALIHELQIHQMELQLQNEELRQAQIELAHSHDRYSELYEHAPVGYLTLDRSGRILQLNLNAARMLGLEHRKLAGRRLSDFVAPEGQDDWHFYLQAMFADVSETPTDKLETRTCDLPLCSDSGTQWWGRLESRVNQGRAENPAECLLVLSDITDRKQAEQALEISERRFRAIATSLEHQVAERTSALAMLRDIAAMANQATDVEAAIQYAIKRVIKHNGWSCGHAWLPSAEDPNWLMPACSFYDETSASLIGLRDRILKMTHRSGEGHVGLAFSTGLPQFTHDAATHLKMEQTVLAEDHDLQTACAFPILAGEKIVGVLEFLALKQISRTDQMRDTMASVGTLLGRVIEREQSKQTFRRSEEELRGILNAAPDAILVVNRKGVMSRVNPATERIFGYAAHEMLGQDVRMLLQSPQQDTGESFVDRYLKGQDSSTFGLSRELKALHHSGRGFPVDFAINEMDDEEIFVVIIRDISERKELEKQVVEATADEQRRIGQDIHDGLGQELTGLRYIAQTHLESLIRQSSLEARTAQRMTEWLANVQRQLRAIIRQLVPVEVDEKGLIAALRGLADQTREVHQLDCQFECLRPVHVSNAALATHLFRISQEAVLNAVRHAESNCIIIQLHESNGTLNLSVIDDGIGIAPATDLKLGIGLRSMAYRASLINARLHISPQKNGGTEVLCVVSQGHEGVVKQPSHPS